MASDKVMLAGGEYDGGVWDAPPGEVLQVPVITDLGVRVETYRYATDRVVRHWKHGTIRVMVVAEAGAARS